MDPDNASGEEDPLADLISLLGRDGFGANNISVREHPSGEWEMYASHDLAAGEALGRRRACPGHPPWTQPRSLPLVLRPGQRLGAGPQPGFPSWWS